MRLEYSLNSALPPLAWAAMVHPSRAECRVLHGSLVETHPTFFIEGAWAGEFAQGDLTATEVFFGSGGTPVGESMVFVASLATTDCVYYCSIKDGTVVGK
jgi:hypothetical protein